MNNKDNSALVTWDDCFRIDVPEIDDQNKSFLDFIDDAQTKLDLSKYKDISSVIKALEDYASYHFAIEEKLLEKSKFPNLIQHKQEHKQFIDRIKQLGLELEYRNPLVAKKAIDFMRKWFIYHIVGKDRKYWDYITQIH